MKEVGIDRSKFIFDYFPLYAKWILENRLQEFTTLGIRYSREENLPVLRPLSRFSDEELVQMAIEPYRVTLKALSQNNIAPHIETAMQRWIGNTMEIIDKDDIGLEDLTIGASIKRKMYRSFLDDYTTDRKLLNSLITEIDNYTSQEELIGYKAFTSLQQEQVKRTHEELKMQESLLLAAEELGDTGSFLIDLADNARSLYTPQYEKIMEKSFHGIPETFIEHVHPQDRELYMDALQKAMSAGGEYEINYRYLVNGKEKRIWSKGISESVNGTVVKIKGTIRDVSKRHELLEQLQESDNLHKQAQEITQLGNWTWDVRENKVTWSDEMFRMYGLEPQSEEISFERFIALVHPDDRANRIREIRESLKTQHSPDYTLRIVTPAGKEHVLKGRGWVETNHNNESIKLHGTCQNITREYNLNRELTALNDALSKKNFELESINRELESFNYIASHDMQEPLRKIHTYVHRLLESDEQISEKGKEYIAKATSSVTRMQKLIRDLITFSQAGTVNSTFEKTDLNKIVEEIKTSLSEQLEESKAKIEVLQLPTIMAIPFQVTQLFTNLIENAVKYRNETVAPQIFIRSSLVYLPELHNPEYDGLGYLQILISDNGIGFEPEQKDKIFDLFTRLHTKTQYSGTGIGLSICKKIVQHHKGFIEAESEKGKGTTFRLLFPATLISEL